ncbi:MAG TPA: MFS transporter [Mycobacteriales bacterium]|nr:MFS transporter [Mycobacteriales bacterium]
MTAAVATTPRVLSRRLLPLQVGVGLQGFMLWLPIEKLFQTQIGFDPASIGVMAAAYAAVVPLLEVPSGILADRWSRVGILVLSSVALAASSALGGVSSNIGTYVAAAMILGVYFAMNSGTVDSVVYDTVLEETGSSDLYEKWIGRVRIVESAAFAASAVAGGVLAGWTSARLTYFSTIPFALLSVVAFLRFREPRLHRAVEPVALHRHVATTFSAMTHVPQVRRVLLLAALAALLAQTVFEFGPLWLVSLDVPAAAYGPYWAALVATLGLGGYLTSKLHLHRALPVLTVAAVMAVTPVLLAVSRSALAVATAQTALLLTLAIIGIHAGLLLHDAVPSSIRAGVSSGVGTLSWLLFLPFSLIFGWLLRDRGPQWASWVLVGVTSLLAALFSASSLARHRVPAELAEDRPEPPDGTPTDVACRELVNLATDYLDDVLQPGWRAAVQDHLSGCDGCTSYLQQIRATVELLGRPDAGVPPPPAQAGATTSPSGREPRRIGGSVAPLPAPEDRPATREQ